MNLIKIKSKTLFMVLVYSLLSPAYAASHPKSTVNDTAIQNEILVYINNYRQQHGLAPLKMDNRIVKEAKIHSMDMAKHAIPFGHKYFKNVLINYTHKLKTQMQGLKTWLTTIKMPRMLSKTGYVAQDTKEISLVTMTLPG